MTDRGTTVRHHPLPAVLSRLQTSLRRALQFYLNGDFVIPGSRRVQLLRPLRLDTCRVPWDIFADSINALDEVNVWGPELRAHRQRLLGPGQVQRFLTFSQAARLLTGLYAILEQLLERVELRPSVDVGVLRPYDARTYRERGLAAVEALAASARRSLAPYIYGFYLHGSLSTLDYTGYSDVDDFIIVKRETALDPAALEGFAAECIKAARFLYEHDPLHHHRHYFATEIDLRWYPPTFLPVEVLEAATAVVGPTILRIATRDSREADRGIFRSYAEGLLRLAAPRASAFNAWYVKTLVSAVLMIPVLYLETRGTYCYKKFSFDMARPAFGPAWDVVDLASEIRRVWRYRPGLTDRIVKTLALDHLANPPLYEHLMRRWARPVPDEIHALLETGRLYAGATTLGETALRLLDAPSLEHVP
jgi:predicted nucleotidyltransferase